MIKLDGATLIFPTVFGYFDPHMLRRSRRSTRRCSSAIAAASGPGQAPEERRQLLRLYRRGPVPERHRRRRMRRRSKKLGFVAAKPIPQVLNNINAFAMGARSVDPEITSRSSSPASGRCRSRRPRRPTAWPTRASTSSPATSTARRSSSRPPSGAASIACGYHADQAKLAPKGYLTGAEWNWVKVYTDFVDAACRPARRCRNFVRGGLKDGFVKMSPYGPAVTAAAEGRRGRQGRDA